MSHVFFIVYTAAHYSRTYPQATLFHHYEEPCLLTGLKWILNYLDYLRSTFCENDLENTVCSSALDEVYVREEKNHLSLFCCTNMVHKADIWFGF